MVKRYSDEKGIILDYNHSRALMELGQNQNIHKVNLTTEMEEVLLSLVIFETGEILESATEGKEKTAEKLASEGLIQYIPRSVFKEAMKFVDSYTTNLGADYGSEYAYTASAQEKSILYYFPLIKASTDHLRYIEFDNARSSMRNFYGAMFGTDFMWTEDPILEDLYENVRKYGHPLASDFLYGGDIVDSVMDSNDEDQHVDPSARIVLEQDNLIAAKVLTAYIEYRGLIQRAALSGRPIKSKCLLSESKIDRTLGPEAMQLFRIHLDEVRIMPYLQSIDDVYRLRGHRHINNFRASMIEWLERITNGELNVEQKYRNSIKIANNELKKLDRWKYVNSPYTLVVSA